MISGKIENSTFLKTTGQCYGFRFVDLSKTVFTPPPPPNTQAQENLDFIILPWWIRYVGNMGGPSSHKPEHWDKPGTCTPLRVCLRWRVEICILIFQVGFFFVLLISLISPSKSRKIWVRTTQMQQWRQNYRFNAPYFTPRQVQVYLYRTSLCTKAIQCTLQE